MIKNIIRSIYWNLVRHIHIYIVFYNKFGQRKSFRIRESVDKHGNPIPWFTFPAIEYLSQFDFSESIVFEYGSGNSTLFWAERVKKIISVEKDKKWHEKINEHNKSNLTLFLHEDRESYVECINFYPNKYDIIVIDGVYRLLCVKQAAKHISDDGFIIFDNSDRHPNCTKYLRENDFFQIDFNGTGAINNYFWTTSIFIKYQTKLQENFINPLPIGGLGVTEID